MRNDYLELYELYHHGIKGQKWGIRRYQNEDGTLTSKGRKKYSKDSSKPASTLKPLKFEDQRADYTTMVFNVMDEMDKSEKADSFWKKYIKEEQELTGDEDEPYTEEEYKQYISDSTYYVAKDICSGYISKERAQKELGISDDIYKQIDEFNKFDYNSLKKEQTVKAKQEIDKHKTKKVGPITIAAGSLAIIFATAGISALLESKLN